jgi:hypothetical protein|tara:strand:+ start:78 stop:290 length:213 start_codon:yes stop_codon:yes gene_type:complete
MTECEYFNAYCELIKKGEEDWKTLSTSNQVWFDEMYEVHNHKDEGWPYNNKYYWVGMILGMNENYNCKEE